MCRAPSAVCVLPDVNVSAAASLDLWLMLTYQRCCLTCLCWVIDELWVTFWWDLHLPPLQLQLHGLLLSLLITKHFLNWDKPPQLSHTRRFTFQEAELLLELQVRSKIFVVSNNYLGLIWVQWCPMVTNLPTRTNCLANTKIKYMYCGDKWTCLYPQNEPMK